MSSAPGPDDAVLAAEWALGLLDPDERRAAEARQLRDPAFARLCERWAGEAALMLGGEDVAPPATLWRQIAAHLPANDLADHSALRRSRGRWRAVALAMTAATVGLGLFTATRMPQPRPAPVLAHAERPAPILVILTSKEGPSVASVSIDRDTGRITVASKQLAAGARSPELWVIPADNVPRSLGLLPARGDSSIAPPSSAPQIRPGMTLAVSLEPLGGSPTGKPTGPIVVTGTI